MENNNEITKYAKLGFLIEIVTDGWANWHFDKNGKPDIKTATPITYDEIRCVGWRGIYWYFDKNGKLHSDDTGLYTIDIGGYQAAFDALVKVFERNKDNIDINAFRL